MTQTTNDGKIENIVHVLKILKFGFRICFGFRASDFEFYGQVKAQKTEDKLALACPV